MVGDDMAVFIDQEFGEVPRDSCGCPCFRGVEPALCAQELVNGTRVDSVDFSFLEHRKSYSISGFCPFKDLVVCARLLFTEFIRREGQDLKAFVLQLFVKLN